MSCGIKLEARRNADFRVTFTPASRKFTFSGMVPLFSVRLGDVVLLQVGPSATPNGSNFVVVGDSVVLTIEKADMALLDSAAPDTSSEVLFFDVTLTDGAAFENWLTGGTFILLGLNDVTCGGCNSTIEASLGGQCIQINIEGGNVGIGASVNLNALNKAVQDAETAAGEAAQSAAEAETAGATAGEAAGRGAAEVVVAGKADVNGSNVEADAFRGAIGAVAASLNGSDFTDPAAVQTNIGLDDPSFQTVKLTKGAVATDKAGLGPELLDGTGWTSAGWTGSVNNWTHTPGNASPLSRAISGVAAGKSYLVVMTISGSTAGSVSLSLGSTILDDSAGTIPLFAGNATFTRGVKVVGTGPFTVTPTSNFDGTVLLSVSEIAPIAASPIFATDSSAALNFEVLPGQASRRNVFIGGGGKLAYSASQCTAIGKDALRDVISGNSNTGIGHSALRDLTSGLFNTAVGGGCGVAITTGWYNTAVGGDALAFTTTGYNNSAFGVDALYLNTTGFNNTALGFSASFNNLGGSGNTSVGFKALFTNTGGTENVAVGSGALEKATTSQNTAVGSSSLINCTTGASNTALGRGSLTSLTTGGTNTAIGGISGFAHTTGSQNVYVGYGSGYTETPANANLTGANSVYVGYQAGPGVATQLANAIGVGYRSHPTKSNQAVFGNNLMVETVYYGVLLPGTAYTVSSLPAATAGLRGARAHVTDATAPTYLGALTGGGSVACPVFCNGSAWVSG